MSLNCTEIEEVIKTLPQSGYIKEILEPDKNSLVISYYDKENSYQLLISAEDRFNRICLVPRNEKIKSDKLRFSQFLNSKLFQAKIMKIYQKDYSRIIVIELLIKDEVKKIIARLWGNAGNILFLDSDETIIDSLKRFSNRGEWPEEIYSFPEAKSGVEQKFIVRPEFNGSIHDNIYLYYKKLKDNQQLEMLKDKIEGVLNFEIKKYRALLSKIMENVTEEKAEHYLYLGEALKANLYKIEKGSKSVKVLDYNTNQEIDIAITPELTPADNVKKFFNKYKKLKEGKIKWEEQKSAIEGKLKTVLDLYDQYKRCDTFKSLEIFQLKLQKSMKPSPNKKNSDEKKELGKVFILTGGYKAIVSRSAKEADEILSRVAKGNDYWFHIRDYAGSHVIVKNIKNEELHSQTKIEASLLALYYSKGKKSDEGDIYFTRVKFLHKAGKEGLVLPTQEKNVKVKFDNKLLEEIFSRPVP